MYYPTRWDWMTYIGTIGMFLMLHVPVPSHPAGDLDLRNAHPAAGSGGEGMKLAKRDPIYGIMAEFDSAQDLVDAGRATHAGRLSARSTPTARFPSKAWPKRSVFITTKFRWSC